MFRGATFLRFLSLSFLAGFLPLTSVRPPFLLELAGSGTASPDAGSESSASDLEPTGLLPELLDPLTEMVEETLRRKWGCTTAQITELRERVESGQILMTFILDGYDELQPQHMSKNLFTLAFLFLSANRFSIVCTSPLP